MRLRRLVWISLILLAMAGALAAQKNKGESGFRPLTGVVTGPSGNPVDGAHVLLKDLKTLSIRSATTRDGGKYRFSGLSVNSDYEVKADYQDMTSETRRLSMFDERKEPVLDLKLEKK